MKSVSVIIPVYNSEKCIAKCIKSVVQQDHRADEIIVVNDGSVDTTLSIVKKFEVRVISKKRNTGVGDARDLGAKAARSDILAFIDSDCVAPRDWLKAALEEFEKDSELGGLGGFYFCPLEGGSLGAKIAKLENDYDYYVNDTTDIFPQGGNSFFLKRVWEEYRSGEEKNFFAGMASGEDTFVWAELKKQTKLKTVAFPRVTHLPPSISQYFKRHINRGKSGTISRLYKLPQNEVYDTGFIDCGGKPLWFSALFLLFAVITIPFVFIFPLIGTGIILFLLLGHMVLAKSFFNFGKKHIKSLKENVMLRFIIMIRHCCWGVGLFKALINFTFRKISFSWRLIKSVMHMLNPRKISRLFFFVTSKCNANCDFCFNKYRIKEKKTTIEEHLSLNEIKLLTKQIKRLPYLTITGGEPFLRNDLFEIVSSFYCNCNLQWLTITTNGSLTESIIEQTKKIVRDCPDLLVTIQVSLDLIGREHDKLRSLVDGFENLSVTLKKLERFSDYHASCRIQISTLYSEFNQHKINDILNFCMKNFTYDSHIFSLLREEGKKITGSTKDLLNSFLKVKHRKGKQRGRVAGWNRILNIVEKMVCEDIDKLRRNPKLSYSCRATKKFVTLYENGEVAPCEVLGKEVLGNIRKNNYDLCGLLESKNIKDYYKRKIEKKCYCDWDCAMEVNIFSHIKLALRLIKKFLVAI